MCVCCVGSCSTPRVLPGRWFFFCNLWLQELSPGPSLGLLELLPSYRLPPSLELPPFYDQSVLRQLFSGCVLCPIAWTLFLLRPFVYSLLLINSIPLFILHLGPLLPNPKSVMIHLKYTIEFIVTECPCVYVNKKFMKAKRKNLTVCKPFTILNEKRDKKSWDSFNIFL